METCNIFCGKICGHDLVLILLFILIQGIVVALMAGFLAICIKVNNVDLYNFDCRC